MIDTYAGFMLTTHGLAAFLGGWAAWGLRGAWDRWQARRAMKRQRAEANARACARMAAEAGMRPEFLNHNTEEETC